MAKKAGKHTKPVFKFRKTDRIGAAGAEDDEFLESCFVDTGNLEILEDHADNRFILLGRTGTGKTAMIRELMRRKPDRVINIRPQNLALTYIVNSTILNFFVSVGVNLDPFFSLLWRHVFTVELLEFHFENSVTNDRRGFIEWLRDLFPNQSREDREMRQKVDYLEKWGKTFWQETEYKVKEITQKIEQQLEADVMAKAGINWAQIASQVHAADKLSTEQKAELRKRGQEVVSKAQVEDLHNVLALLDAVFGDRQKSYYLVVDSLDEGWVEDGLRHKLIMALIQTAREFADVRNAKVILALRRDLIDRVFRLARSRDSGFQEEKYQSLYLPLSWTQNEIVEVLDRRVRHLVERRYTSSPVSYKDLLPSEFDGMQMRDFIYSIARKPRDVIAFFNTCIQGAVDQPNLNKSELSVAEGEYSRQRLRALADEWKADYPMLLDFAQILHKRPKSFKIGCVTQKEIEDVCLVTVAENPGETGQLLEMAKAVVDSTCTWDNFRFFLFQVFYKVALVGLKVGSYEQASWADDLGQSVTRSQISIDASAVVNPCYYKSLGVVDGRR